MNGLAGIAIIKHDFPQAVSLYKEALSLVEEHSEDFRLDPLLNIHIHHNLADILPLTVNSLEQFQHDPGRSKEILSGACDIDEKAKCATARDKMIRHDSSLNIYENTPSPSCLSRYCSNEKCSDIATYVSKNVQSLRTVCEDLKNKFLSVFITKLSLAQQEFRKSHEQVWCFRPLTSCLFDFKLN